MKKITLFNDYHVESLSNHASRSLVRFSEMALMSIVFKLVVVIITMLKITLVSTTVHVLNGGNSG